MFLDNAWTTTYYYFTLTINMFTQNYHTSLIKINKGGIMKVKVIDGSNIKELENEINNFLQYNTDITIIDIKLSVSDENKVALIIYRTN